MVQTVAAVKQAYWTLKASLANVTVQQRSLELAQELARENKVRVDVGQIPPLDLVQAEAEVAQRRENLIRAATAAEDAEDALRRLIVDPADVSFWRVRIDPAEEPTPVGPAPDVDAAVAQALDRRYDLARAGHELDNAKTTVDFLRNQRLPDVRLETSYRGSGLSGTQFLRSGGFPGSVIGTPKVRFRRRARPGVFERLPDLEPWPDGELSARPQLRRSEPRAGRGRAPPGRAAHLRACASRPRKPSVAPAVRFTAPPNGSMPRAPVRRSQQNDSQTEQRRYEVGLSTTFLVTQAQRDLLEAQVNLLQTTLDYESALVNFEAVQQAPPLAAGDTVGVRGAAIVQLPTPAPQRHLPSRRGHRILRDPMNRPIAVVGAPSSIGIRPYDDGEARHLDRAPGVLRERGLDRRGSARSTWATSCRLRIATTCGRPIARETRSR